MAIINSIVMGKSKGKIGNVVTTTLKGQVIAKSRNFTPANPKSTLQVASRGKMSNVVKAWQFLAIFLLFTKPFAKATESTYNAFVSFAKNLFDSVVFDYGFESVASLGNVSLFVSKIATINLGGFAGSYMTVNIIKNGIAWTAGLRYRYISYSEITGESVLVDAVLTEVIYNLQELLIPIAGLQGNGFGVYIYDSNLNTCSNVALTVNP